MTTVFGIIGLLSTAFLLCLAISRTIVEGTVQRLKRHHQRLRCVRPALAAGIEQYRRSLHYERHQSPDGTVL